MSDPSFDPLSDSGAEIGPIIDEFIESTKRPNPPSVEEFASRYPEHQQALIELLPTLMLIEDVGQVPEQEPSHAAQLENHAQASVKSIGAYHVVREIGRGGMGIVYEAIDPALGRRVALKVLVQNILLQPDRLQRFQREARAVANLNHANIVPIYAVGEADGTHYFAMRYIEGASLDLLIDQLRTEQIGEDRTALQQTGSARLDVATEILQISTLTTRLRMGSLAPQDEQSSSNARSAEETSTLKVSCETNSSLDKSILSSGSFSSANQYFRNVANLGLQAAEALEYAHRRGILHRDIKPANLMLDDMGNLWVADFGLAKSSDSNLTQTGELVGTVRYMSPDRLRGADDARCDVYSLGATLFELATLEPLYPGSDRAAVFSEILEGSPKSLRSYQQRMPRALETIIEKSIHREPKLRYQSAGELAEDLQRFIEDRPILARKSSWWQQTAMWCRRNPVPAILCSVILLLMIFSSIGSAIFGWQMHLKNLEVSESADKEKKARIELERALFDNYLTNARNTVHDFSIGRRERGMIALENAQQLKSRIDAISDSKRVENELFQIRADLLGLIDLKPFQDFKFENAFAYQEPDWAFSHSMDSIALPNKHGQIIVQHLNGKTRASIPHEFNNVLLEFSPNDQFLLIKGRLEGPDGDIDGDHLMLWDLHQNKAVVSIFVGGSREQKSFCFSADSQTVCFVDQLKQLCLVSTEDGVFYHQSDPLTQRPSWLKLDKMFGNLLVGYPDSVCVYAIHQRSILTKPPRFDCASVDSSYLCGAWVESGGLFFVGTSQGNIQEWNVENDTQPVREFQGHRSAVINLRMDVVNQMIMSVEAFGKTRFWDYETGELKLGGEFFGQKVASDGTQVAAKIDANRYQVFKLVQSAQSIVKFGWNRTHRILDLSFSSDSNYLVWAAEHAGMSMVDLRTMESSRIHDDLYAYRSARFFHGVHQGAYSLLTSGGQKSSDEAIQLEILQMDQQGITDQGGLNLAMSKAYHGHNGFVNSLPFNGNQVAMVNGSNQLICATLDRPGEKVIQIDKLELPLQSERIALAENGTKACVWRRNDPRCIVVDLVDLKIVWTNHHEENTNFMACLSPDGNVLVIVDERQVRVLNIEDKKMISQIPLNKKRRRYVGNAAFSRDGIWLAIALDNSILIIDTKDWSEKLKLHSADRSFYTSQYTDLVPPIDFSADSRLLAIGTNRNLVHLWDLAELLKSE